MAWLPVSFAVVGWIVGTLAVLMVRGKQLSGRLAMLVLLFSTVSAGAVQYALFTGVRKTERLSGAHLVGVTSLRMQEYADFIRSHLSPSAGETDDEQRSGADIDWAATFNFQATHISETLAAVERNVFIRNNYSVWIGEVEFRRAQLEDLAKNVATAPVGSPRQTSLAAYLELIDDTVTLLDGLAHEMRSRPPEDYYSDD